MTTYNLFCRTSNPAAIYAVPLDQPVPVHIARPLWRYAGEMDDLVKPDRCTELRLCEQPGDPAQRLLRPLWHVPLRNASGIDRREDTRDGTSRPQSPPSSLQAAPGRAVAAQ
jgi:hypothetical protein